jgi:uncharacterized protein YacL
MGRMKTDVAQPSTPPATEAPVPTQDNSLADGGPRVWLVRAALVMSIAALAYAWRPFGIGPWPAAGGGLVAAFLLVIAELRLRRTEIRKVAAGTAGLLLGIFIALLVCLVVSRTSASEPTKSFLDYALLVGFGYLGALVGASKGSELRFEFLQEASPSDGHAKNVKRVPKLLDTSVLIDGRIAEICEAQFLDGPLVVPQFVLHELQQIADSSDTLRRQRGRRGLEVLQRIQKMENADAIVLDADDSAEGDVDRKLVELARKMGAKIVTNDFNLNKVASVQGISVLNVNQLANALRPAVMPGEPMRVFVLREGKEANQGVAYLEDGTMVVVDGARRMLNRNVDITVTSVHQTPAGKMIFGRLQEERGENSAPLTRQAAAGRGDNGGRIANAPPEPGLKRETLDPKKGFD